ncbi:MAG: NAD(P)/FAD-dependent oxidoreductase [Gammaproteobacteria bacterium]|nr:NAD(P)/FAD-dependent oxidoreductase [Gammaproteobacteria bacterium]
MAVQGSSLPSPGVPREVDAVVVGAGFAGLYMLLLLRDELQLDVVGLEAASGVGGVWYWNRYPGARCDIASCDYSYSFSAALQQEWRWPEKYPAQPDILAYLEHVASRFDLARSFRFDARVDQASFDESAQRWIIRTADGSSYRAKYFIPATGVLSEGNVPRIPGHEHFDGRSCFTGRWPRDGVDFSGKRVGIIGTGATAVQAIPVIAEQAAHLTVFQRTPYFAVPLQNKPLSDAEDREIKAHYAELRASARAHYGGVNILEARPHAMADTPEARRAHYQSRYDAGGFNVWCGSYGDIFHDAEANETAAEFVREKIRERVRDPKIAEMLCPRPGVTYGTKRQPCESGYFETYNRDNVTLVDIHAAPIAAITPRGVRTSDAEYALDYLIYATGFDAFTAALFKMNVSGRGGRSLNEHWAAGPRTYLGLCTAGFPNLFNITGPQSPSVFYNFPPGIEMHCEWIAACIEYMEARGLGTIDADPASEEDWLKHIVELADRSLMPKASSWYMGDNIPGKPRVFMFYLGGGKRYRELIEREAAAGYPGFRFAAARAEPVPAVS